MAHLKLEKINLGDFVSNEKHGNLIIESLATNTKGEIKDAGATDKAMIEFVERAQRDYTEIRN